MLSSTQWPELIVRFEREREAIDAAYMAGQLGTKIKELADAAREQYTSADKGSDGEEGSGVPTS